MANPLGVLLALALQEPSPAPFEAAGKLVCLLEEMKEKHQAEVPPVHVHVLGFRREGELPEGALRYYTLLRTRLSEALFTDARFKDRELRLRGRVFPGTGVLDVNRLMWTRDSKLYEVYYWCDVCAIRGMNPGPCACCQGSVELREAEVEEKGD
jgi:hypothetical protein